MTNFNDFKTATAVKNEARKIVFEMVKEFFIDKCGAENVSEIGSNEIALCIGTKDLQDGTTAEVCVSIKPTAKDYENRKTASKSFEAFERILAEEEWETKQKEKEEKKQKQKNKKDKSKTEKQEELEERAAELDEVAKKVKEKRDQETQEIYKKLNENKND